MITKKTDIIAIDAVCDELRRICGEALLEGKDFSADRVNKLKMTDMHTVGFLISEDEDCIRIASTTEKHASDDELGFDYVFLISKKMITEMKVLEEVGK